MTPRPKPTAAPETAQSVEGAVRRSGPDPAKTYHGKACTKCGGTQRWKGTRHCVPCDRERTRRWHHQKQATDPEYVARKARRARDWYADPANAERQKQRARDRYDNDTLFRHELLLKQQLQKSQRRLKEAEQRG